MEAGFTTVQATFSRVLFAAIAAFLFFYGSTPAMAQSTFTYINTANGALDDSVAPCGSPLTRTYVVGDAFTVGDVDIGVRGEHTYRGDLRVTLVHPDGTRAQVVDGNGSVSGDNFNFRLNDGGTQTVNTDGNTALHSSAAVGGAFQHNFIPNSPLAVFNSKPSNGTWTLEICDRFGGDSGNFFHSELYLTEQLADFADLSLTKTVSNAAPANNSNVTFTLSLTNSAASNQTASTTVLDLLPSGFEFQSVGPGSDGTYVEATGIWTPPSIAPGVTHQLLIVAKVVPGAGVTLTNIAQVQTSNRVDPDSVPGNDAAGEDDYAAVSLTTTGTRAAGIPPTLVCPDGSIMFSWAGRTWTPGSTDNTYTLAGLGTVRWELVSPAGWLSIPAFGGEHPRLTTAAQGITTLSKAIDFDNRDQVSTTTVTLGNVVDGMQFRIIDVDFGAADFADKVTVTGSLNGSTVIPVLTNGTANYVVGNSAFGDAPSDSADTDGDVYATFSDPIDSIVIEYGNHSLAPTDPDGQAIQMDGSISICSPVADISVTKISAVLDDQVAGPADEFNLPGATLSYCILVSNMGNGTASNVVATDILPSTTTFVPGSMRSGTGCNTASVLEDDDSDDVTEVDGTTASFAVDTVSIEFDEVAGNSAKVITFTAAIN